MNVTKGLKAQLTRTRHRFVRRTFRFWERLGVHVTLVSPLSPVPDTRRLPVDAFTRRSGLVGLEMRDIEQLALLETFRRAYHDECARFPLTSDGLPPYAYYMHQEWYGALDASIYWCMIRHFQPAKVIEVGAGVSTFLAAQALRANSDDGAPTASLVAIEPHPGPQLVDGFPGLTRLISAPVQAVSLEEFTALEAGDILFIDSSHALSLASDVQYELLEIIPRLRPGVLVHFHDILLPGEYHEEWVRVKQLFWNEQYAVQAFLAFNSSFEVLLAASYLHHRHPAVLQAAFSNYRGPRDRPSALWIRRAR